MFDRSRISLLLGLVLWASVCVAQSQEPTLKSLADFDAIVTKAMADSNIPGMSVAIVRDGKVFVRIAVEIGRRYRVRRRAHGKRAVGVRSESSMTVAEID